MSESEDQSENEEVIAQYKRRENDFNVIKQRIDTSNLLNDFKTYLTGSHITLVEDEKGNIRARKILYGVPKANDSGIQNIMLFLSSVVNSHTIQGNFPLDSRSHSDAYENYCHDVELDLATDIMINLPEYDISEQEFQSIINSAMASIRPIMSRCIDNKERESYGETSRHIESHSDKPKTNNIFKQM